MVAVAAAHRMSFVQEAVVFSNGQGGDVQGQRTPEVAAIWAELRV
jgi:hypothetical protein